jgi:hypothetical protein
MRLGETMNRAAADVTSAAAVGCVRFFTLKIIDKNSSTILRDVMRR